MKINITFKIELNEKDWAEHNGVATNEVREDVKRYLLHEVRQSVLLEEASATIELKP